MPPLRLCAFAMLLLSIAALLGCGGGAAPPPQMPPPQVTVTRPVVQDIQHYLEYNGNLEAVQTVQIKARVRGFLDEICFKEGEEVAEKKLLYQIDPREYDANVAKSKSDIEKSKADIANAKAQIRLAEAELERMKKASAGGVAAKSDLDKAEAQLAANKAQLDTANASLSAAEASLKRSNLDLEYTSITAPIAGRIGRTLVTKGNLVGQNEQTLLTTINLMDPIYVTFDTPERDLIEYQRSLKGRTLSDVRAQKVEVAIATEEGFPHKGIIDFRDNKVEPGTGTIRIRGRIPNPLVNDRDRLLFPGLFAHVRVPMGEPQPLPVIPESALMTGQDGRFLFVVGSDNTIVRRKVTVGPKAPEQGWTLVNPNPPANPGPLTPPSAEPVLALVAIEEGLKADERIVVSGLQRARPGAPVTPDEWQLRAPTAKK